MDEWDDLINRLLDHMVIEEGHSTLSAYIPTLPGVAVAGDTEDECRARMHEAVRQRLVASQEA